MNDSEDGAASEAAFRLLFIVMATLAVVLLVLFPSQEPGTGPWVISIVTLAVQAVVCAVALAGLYFEWDPLGPIFGE